MAAQGAGKQRLEDEFLMALCHHSTVAAAAAAVGLSERTAYRWLATPEFVARWDRLRRQRMSAALERLEAVAADAVDCLRRNLSCGTPSVEVAAARTVMDLGLRAMELLELENRVDELERLTWMGHELRR